MLRGEVENDLPAVECVLGIHEFHVEGVPVNLTLARPHVPVCILCVALYAAQVAGLARAHDTLFLRNVGVLHGVDFQYLAVVLAAVETDDARRARFDLPLFTEEGLDRPVITQAHGCYIVVTHNTNVNAG